MSTVAPYGTWESPITAEQAAAVDGGPAWVELAGGRAWWTDARPLEGGRVAIVHAAVRDARPVDALPPGWNARNRVHEYGGKPFTVIGDALVFTSWDDQRLYAVEPGAAPVPLTPAPERRHGLRYADPVVAPGGGHVWCVRETITGDAPTDVRRELVAVPLDGSAADDPGAVRVLAASHHFMTTPRPSPDGRRAAWIGWNHPAMPWDGTELCVASVSGPAAAFGAHRVVAGGPAEAVCQVEWGGPDAVLAMTDPDGWWNLHRIDLATGAARNLSPMAEELGGALWRLGMRWFVPLGGGRHAVLRNGRLAVLDGSGRLTDVPTELAWWCATLTADGGAVASAAGGPRHETTVAMVDLSTFGPGADSASGSGMASVSGTDAASGVSAGVVPVVELKPRTDGLPDAAFLPQPVELTFAAPDGAQIPAYVYPPTNPLYRAPDGERPPFIVHVHGGPTSRNSPMLDLTIAFFTSRGFGVVAPDYGGSTGHGRAYRERLREQWGIVDVADCAAVALALAAAGGATAGGATAGDAAGNADSGVASGGVADGERLVIRGGSAGGWTVAASLVSPARQVYRCGTSMYPILDLVRWGEDGGETHDFESRYLHSLIGQLPETIDRYVDRSPINHVDRLAGPILLMQGLDDQICPPVQAGRLVSALAGSGIPHAYLTFDGEQHGFRKAETIATALNAELSFYAQVLGFDPPGVKRLELSS